MPVHTLTQTAVQRVRMRLVLRVLYIYAFTGVWAEPSHPYLRDYRFITSSRATPGTIIGKHLPLTYEKA